MNPAPSIIVFTVLSGLGLGLMVWVGLGFGGGWPGHGLALGLTAAGGAASTLHLARPDRAWRAFSQWSSSWLSREACLMVLAVGLFAAHAVLGGAVLGGLAALAALATIHCTAMIYAQLRTVPLWHRWQTPLLFLALGLAGGRLVQDAVTGAATPLSLAALALAALAQGLWQSAPLEATTTLATATGLGSRGAVRAFESPHTGTNYLLREMAYTVARRHANRIRALGWALGFGLPALGLAAVLAGAPGLLSVPSALAHLAGMLALRWLFFAEARHVQALYYGLGTGATR